MKITLSVKRQKLYKSGEYTSIEKKKFVMEHSPIFEVKELKSDENILVLMEKAYELAKNDKSGRTVLKIGKIIQTAAPIPQSNGDGAKFNIMSRSGGRRLSKAPVCPRKIAESEVISQPVVNSKTETLKGNKRRREELDDDSEELDDDSEEDDSAASDIENLDHNNPDLPMPKPFRYVPVENSPDCSKPFKNPTIQSPPETIDTGEGASGGGEGTGKGAPKTVILMSGSHE